MPPTPKRSEERRRRNIEGRAEKVEVAGSVRVPALSNAAHSLARQWYRSLAHSGQVRYFEPSDWAAALLVCEQLTRLLADPAEVPASAFATIWSAMNDLLTTEGARRRVRLEVERRPSGAGEAALPGVSDLADFRRRMEAQA